MSIYRVALLSEEQRGSTKPNIIELGFDSDADAGLFSRNLTIGGLTSAVCPSVDVELSTNYALPYPAGTEASGRCAWWNAAGYPWNMPFANVPLGFVPITRTRALIAAGVLIPTFLPGGGINTNAGAPTRGNAEVFDLGVSV